MQQAHVSSLEDKLRSALASQHELQLQSRQQKHTISDLQVKSSQLSLESDDLRCRVENLKQVRSYLGMKKPGTPTEQARKMWSKDESMRC